MKEMSQSNETQVANPRDMRSARSSAASEAKKFLLLAENSEFATKYDGKISKLRIAARNIESAQTLLAQYESKKSEIFAKKLAKKIEDSDQAISTLNQTANLANTLIEANEDPQLHRESVMAKDNSEWTLEYDPTTNRTMYRLTNKSTGAPGGQASGNFVNQMKARLQSEGFDSENHGFNDEFFATVSGETSPTQNPQSEFWAKIKRVADVIKKEFFPQREALAQEAVNALTEAEKQSSVAERTLVNRLHQAGQRASERNQKIPQKAQSRGLVVSAVLLTPAFAPALAVASGVLASGAAVGRVVGETKKGVAVAFAEAKEGVDIAVDIARSVPDELRAVIAEFQAIGYELLGSAREKAASGLRALLRGINNFADPNNPRIKEINEIIQDRKTSIDSLRESAKKIRQGQPNSS